jgi:hypothetical protein
VSTSTFNALVRFDILARDVEVSVGGRVEVEALDELCEVIERSVSITGKHANVDLTDAEVAPRALELMCLRCGEIADFATDQPG